MKRIYLTLFSFALILTFNVDLFGQCKAKQIANSCKDNMRKPFKYDSYALNEFTFDDKEKQVEVQFTAFQGQKYKIVFCSSGFDEPVVMNVYDKSMKIHNNRHKLYDNTNGIDSNFWTFEPTKSGNYFILYEIPKSIDGAVKKGCVVMLIGYVDDEEK
jgi:hypothetical protein